MKHIHKFLGTIPLCLAAALLCGLFTVSALAVNPGEVALTLTWTGVDASANDGAVNGQPVTAGNLTLYEEGIQLDVGGQRLIPIDPSGTTTIQYAFDPTKEYTITVEEKAASPYYMTRDIVLTQAQVSQAASSGLALNETVEWVEWSKPIKVSLVDVTGAPMAQQGVSVTLSDNDRFTFTHYDESRETNVSGVATFPSHSYDPEEPDMCNILHNQVLISAQYQPTSGNPTTVAQIVMLENNNNQKKNEVNLVWPSTTVSGTVKNMDGSPAPNTRVAAYFYLPSANLPLVDQSSLWSYNDPYGSSSIPDSKTRTLKSTAAPRVYYTTSDANGNYTLALPAGYTAQLCAGDTQVTIAETEGIFTGSVALGRYNGTGAAAAYKAIVSHFPWFSVANTPRDAYGELPMDFDGIFCKELSPLSVTMNAGDLTGQDLTLNAAANGYTLNGTIKINGQPCPAHMTDMPLYFAPSRNTSSSSSTSNSLHKGGGDWKTFLEIRDGVTQSSLNKDGVRLLPGEYNIVFTAFSDEFILEHINLRPVVKTITMDDIKDGVVNLGDLDFQADLRPVGGENAKTPAEILSHFNPIPAPQDYSYLSTRIEAVPDPAYGPFAYQFTIHYCGHNTNKASSTVTGGQLQVTFPSGVTVPADGGMVLNGNTLTKSLPTLTAGEVDSITFTADIDHVAQDDVTFELASAPNYGGINSNTGDNTLRLNSSVTLKRPHLTLNAPRTVEQATKFRVFGNAAGTDGEGIYLYNTVTDKAIATGALKGRFYYFNVGGQSAGTYTLAAQSKRFGVDERSNTVDVEVVPTASMKVEDAYIMRGGKRTDINANFGMVYYTAFVDADKLVPAFDLFFKLSQAPAPGETVELDIGGVTFPAALDPATGYYKATVSSLYSVGEQAVLLKVGSGFTTQIACLMLLF